MDYIITLVLKRQNKLVFIPDNVNGYTGHVTIGNTNNFAYGIIYFQFSLNGMGINISGIDYKIPFNANQWYLIEFKNIDYVTETYDYYVDGQLAYANLPFGILLQILMKLDCIITIIQR